MIIAGTGSRPPSLGGYKLPNPIYCYVCQETEKILLNLKPDKIISGMALGYDQYLANIAIKLNIPFIAAIPFQGQDVKWPDSSRRIYNKLLTKAAEIVIVSEPGFSAKKLQIRNEWMVDHCDILLAAFDGSIGGTRNCVNYANSINKQVIRIDTNNVK